MDTWPTTAMDACNSVSPASPVAQALPAATLHIHPTTGGHFELQVALSESVEALKALVSKRLKVPKERICLLYRERHLREGTLQQNSVFDGCKLTLLPSVETGLLAQRPEQSVMNALESLSDGQVNDFLCGKAPLNLTMRLGDHMMFIQLQLSTVAPTSSSSTSTNTSTSLPSTSSIPTSPLAVSAAKPKPSAVAISQPTPHTTDESPATTSIPTTLTKPVLDTKALAEASRNLTHTLRQLSNAALSGRGEENEDALTLRRRQGAIIESMHHHGRGVYSGTFSGTLNPALQDCHGRPRRDISTIIHILNDLLGATPHYRRRGNRGRITSPTSTTEHAHTKNESEASLTKSQEMRPNSRLIGILPTPTEERQRLTQENRATRGKMEQLQLMLEERRARRRARREARAPYAWPGYTNGSGSGSSGQTPAVRDCEDSNNASASDFHPLSTPETVVA